MAEPRKPQTTHKATDLFTMSDPRKDVVLYKRHIFKDNPEAYKEFLEAWDWAKGQGARYTFVVAMIRFRRTWDDSTGEWYRTLPKEVEGEFMEPEDE